MSSAGIDAINSGPLIIRTYNNSSPNKTVVLENYDNPVSSNYVLITSSGGLIVPSDRVTISSISVSSFYANSTFSNFSNISSLNASTAFIANLITCTISSNIGWISTLDVALLNGAPYVPGAASSWTIGPGTVLYNTNVGGKVGINTAGSIDPETTFQVNGSLSTNGINVLRGDTYIQGSTQITNYLSCNTILMNSGLISSSGTNPLYVTNSLHISSGNNDGDASLYLFNDKAYFATNATYDGCYLELSSIGPNFYITGFNGAPVYAKFTSTSHQVNNGLTVYAPSTISSYQHRLILENNFPGPAAGATDVVSRFDIKTILGNFSWYLTNNQATSPYSGLLSSHLQLWAYDFPLIGGLNHQVIDFAPTGNTILWGDLAISTALISTNSGLQDVPGNLSVVGNARVNTYLSTPTIYMSSSGSGNGQITGLSSINNVRWPYPDPGLIPLGGIIMWSGTSLNLPVNWALCDGGTYGATNIVTPDLRGRFIIGATFATGTTRYNNMAISANPLDANLSTCSTLAVGASGGEQNHVLTIGEMPEHNHQYSFAGNPNDGYVAGPPFINPSFCTYNVSNLATTSTGSSQQHNNIPQFFSLAYIMRISSIII